MDSDLVFEAILNNPLRMSLTAQNHFHISRKLAQSVPNIVSQELKPVSFLQTFVYLTVTFNGKCDVLELI